MHTEEAIKRIEEFGWKVYPHEMGWKVYDNNTFNGFYSDRELINFAKSKRGSKWKPRSSKTKVGPGGIYCPCCTKAPKAEMKKWDNRRSRKNIHIEVDDGVDFE